MLLLHGCANVLPPCSWCTHQPLYACFLAAEPAAAANRKGAQQGSVSIPASCERLTEPAVHLGCRPAPPAAAGMMLLALPARAACAAVLL